MRAHRYSVPRPPVLSLIIAISSIVLGACSAGGPVPAPTQAQTATTTSAVTSPTADLAPIGATVTLGPSAFSQSAVTLSAGQSLRMDDPSTNGGTHILCLGANGQCDASAQGPQNLLAPGLSLHSGDSVVIDFPQAGMYVVTCTIHPSMHLTISVLGVG